MKLRNKKTGEILDDAQYRNYSLSDGFGFRMNGKEWEYHSLAELNKEWEDYEEPKECYYIDPSVMQGYCRAMTEQFPRLTKLAKELGIGFETKEEAEKAVEKLKAWKRLKDKGFRFNGKEVFSEGLLEIDGVLPALKGADNAAECLKIIDDLDLLFGGEE